MWYIGFNIGGVGTGSVIAKVSHTLNPDARSWASN
jgi:hypothetical protein